MKEAELRSFRVEKVVENATNAVVCDGELSDKEAKDAKKEKEKQKEEKKRDSGGESKKSFARAVISIGGMPDCPMRRNLNERGDGGGHAQSPAHGREMRRGHLVEAVRQSTSEFRGVGEPVVAFGRRRRSTSYSRSSESSSSSDSSESRSRSRSRERTPPKKRRERERSFSRSSEDSEDARERRNLKKQIKEKEQAYVARLTKWEARERQKAKQYEREERREKDRRRDILKEAKKLKHFLEDYDDEKDDPKYYKSSSLFQRKRDFEREREADSKDRLREQQEIEELRKQILAENKDVQDVDEEARRRHFEKEEAAMRRLREDSGSPNPHQPLGQRDGDADSSSSSADSDDEDEGKSIDGRSIGDDEEDTKTQKSDAPPSNTTQEDRWKSGNVQLRFQLKEGVVDVTSQSTPISVSSPVTLKGASSSTSLPAIQRPELNTRLNGVFGVDDEDEEGGRKHLRPFEITQEERMETLTTDEKKRLVKDLINNIPTTKEELFAHTIDWRYVDRTLIEQRVRPWVAKKILEFLGEEEVALVNFVCEKVASKTSPDRILSDIAMILDEDAEVFVVKMWRLLIYESEAKKLGLVVPRSNQ
ncbi:unnamed protein product [Nippostrongylus brasiliensis]|uniref:RNA-binding protein 25 (inferred by orthology to a human protein) n=1 Tax=Nippostrongylus brasiliensis TaxID=27835 RepID=A0A0N4YXA6_NIPBR|nr:unnamed protein product [Nippostrongylus brasiliensis]